MLSLELWYQALASPHGTIIQTDDPERCKAKLYALRKEAQARGDNSLDNLSLVQSPTNPKEEIWIVKKGQTNAA